MRFSIQEFSKMAHTFIYLQEEPNYNKFKIRQVEAEYFETQRYFDF